MGKEIFPESIHTEMEPAEHETESAKSVAAAAKGRIKVQKISYFEPAVTGAGYGVYTDKACTKAVDALWIGTVDADSDISIDLSSGTYYVKEFSAPKGYTLDKEVHMVTLKNNGKMELVTSYEPTTEPHGNIKVIKESSSSSPVTGAGYGVYKDEACTKPVDALWIGTVDANSDISVDLPLATYYVKEFIAPKGYALDPTVYTVTLTGNGQLKTVTLTEPVLYDPDGKPFDKTEIGSVFPSCVCDAYNVLGWSTTRHGIFSASSIKAEGKNMVEAVGDYFMEGDSIPAGNVKKYYMVAYSERKDGYTVEVSKPTNGTVVYFVGDSRTVYIYDQLVTGKVLSNKDYNQNRPLDGMIEFVAKSGQGIDWFMNLKNKEEGLPYLESRLTANKGKNNVIIFNLGVNDAPASNIIETYETKFKNVAADLRGIDSRCRLYYADVYPVSSATLEAHNGKPSVEMKHIKEINETIDKICQNGYFSKINLYDHLKNMDGFILSIPA